MDDNLDSSFQEQFNNVDKNPRLYVGNLDYKTRVNDIRDVFGKYGDIVAIQIKSGFAFIEYEKPTEANSAREIMNLRKFNGRTIIVRPACKNFFINFVQVPKLDSRSPSKSISPTKRKEDVSEDDKNTCFFCGKKGHWKKDCKKRQKFIEDKIANGELDQDYYGLNKRIRSGSRETSNSSKKEKKKSSRRRDGSSSLSYSIPSDCESCKRILKDRKRKSRKTKRDKSKSHSRLRRFKNSLSPKITKDEKLEKLEEIVNISRISENNTKIIDELKNGLLVSNKNI